MIMSNFISQDYDVNLSTSFHISKEKNVTVN